MSHTLSPRYFTENHGFILWPTEIQQKQNTSRAQNWLSSHLETSLIAFTNSLQTSRISTYMLQAIRILWLKTVPTKL